MRSITFDKINITGGFWKSRQEINRSATINAVWNRFSDTGRVKAFGLGGFELCHRCLEA